MVALGGDVAVAGTAPAGGWRIGVGVDHELALEDPEVIVTVADGGLATSGTIRRAWRWGDRPVHHIVDPRTGDVAGACWCAVTVAARTCVEANTASTAAVVLGADAPDWLGARGLPARLVGVDGAVVTTPGWPGGEG
jgi:thiamine biosynthesis lipoprotein